MALSSPGTTRQLRDPGSKDHREGSKDIPSCRRSLSFVSLLAALAVVGQYDCDVKPTPTTFSLGSIADASMSMAK